MKKNQSLYWSQQMLQLNLHHHWSSLLEKRLPQVQESLPDGYSVGFSDNSWMTAKSFYEYITNIFHPWLRGNGIIFPIILFIDGHASHMSLPLSEFCQNNQIELVALKANTTHILQPLDVAFFRPFKSSWLQNCMEFCRKNNLFGLKKYQFLDVLKYTLKNMEIEQTLKNGFRTCGLYPFDENAINYEKVTESRIYQVKSKTIQLAI